MTSPYSLPRFRSRSVFLAGALLLASLSGAGLLGCRRQTSETQESPAKRSPPSLRLYVLGGAAGAVEPCGCVKDMLGGVDHAVAYVKSQKANAPNALVLGAGPMFFEDPKSVPEERTQALFKAEAMASSLRELGLHAWAPGANDFSQGAAEFHRLTEKTGASPLGANLKLSETSLPASEILTLAGLKVGLLGLSVPKPPGGTIAELGLLNQLERLDVESRDLTQKGAEIKILLIAADRGEALRLAEKASGFQLVIVGKGHDQGDKNDETFPPELIGSTLVVQAPNHLQGISVVDLFVRDNQFQFQDGSGLAAFAERESRQKRADELARRVALWEKPTSGVAPEEVLKAREDLKKLKADAGKASAKAPEKGSYFLYDFVQVREALGEDKAVVGRIAAYYERVNEHNRELFQNKLPIAAKPGEKSYVGIATCATCHAEEFSFWQKTGHAKAYATLSSDHKEFNLDCVSCHVTGYEKPGGSTVTHVENLTDVQCEVCHGPGSAHVAGGGDKSAIRRVPELTLCAETCHHTPHVGTDWNVGAALPKILGPGHGG